MGAAFDHVAFSHDVDAVRSHDLGEAVGDDDHRVALLDGGERVFDLLGGDGVEAGGGLAGEDDGRVFEEEPGDGDALLLAAAELPGIGLVAARQVRNLVVQVGLAGGGFNVGPGGGEVAVANIFFDGALSTMVFLKYQADLLVQGKGVVLGQRAAVAQHFAAIGAVKLAERVDDGAFVRPAEARQRGSFAGLNGQAHIVQCRRAAGVDANFLAVIILPEGDESADNSRAQQNIAHPDRHGPAGVQAAVAVEQALHRVHGVAQHKRVYRRGQASASSGAATTSGRQGRPEGSRRWIIRQRLP